MNNYRIDVYESSTNFDVPEYQFQIYLPWIPRVNERLFLPKSLCHWNYDKEYEVDEIFYYYDENKAEFFVRMYVTLLNPIEQSTMDVHEILGTWPGDVNDGFEDAINELRGKKNE